MAELATMGHVVGVEQDADIAIEFARQALSGTTRPAGFTVLRQVPPKFLRHALIDHPVADLLGCQILFDPHDHCLSELWMPEQLALLHGLIRGYSKVTGVNRPEFFGDHQLQ